MFDGALQLLYEGVQVSGAVLPMQQQFAAQVAEAGPQAEPGAGARFHLCSVVYSLVSSRVCECKDT